MPSTFSFSAHLCPPAVDQLDRLTRAVCRKRDTPWGAKAEVLRWSLFYAIGTPLPRNVFSLPCPHKKATVRKGHVSGTRPKGVEGDALSIVLPLLPLYYPGGSMHDFIESGLRRGGADILHVLTKASREEREALTLSLCQLTYLDLCPGADTEGG